MLLRFEIGDIEFSRRYFQLRIPHFLLLLLGTLVALLTGATLE